MAFPCAARVRARHALAAAPVAFPCAVAGNLSGKGAPPMRRAASMSRKGQPRRRVRNADGFGRGLRACYLAAHEPRRPSACANLPTGAERFAHEPRR